MTSVFVIVELLHEWMNEFSRIILKNRSLSMVSSLIVVSVLSITIRSFADGIFRCMLCGIIIIYAIWFVSYSKRQRYFNILSFGVTALLVLILHKIIHLSGKKCIHMQKSPTYWKCSENDNHFLLCSFHTSSIFRTEFQSHILLDFMDVRCWRFIICAAFLNYMSWLYNTQNCSIFFHSATYIILVCYTFRISSLFYFASCAIFCIAI